MREGDGIQMGKRYVRKSGDKYRPTAVVGYVDKEGVVQSYSIGGNNYWLQGDNIVVRPQYMQQREAEAKKVELVKILRLLGESAPKKTGTISVAALRYKIIDSFNKRGETKDV